MNEPNAQKHVELVTGTGRIRLGTDPMVIGRNPHAAIQLTGEGVSRQHAVIVRTADGVIVRDLGSANGTYVNDALIEKPRQLQHEDVVRIGTHSIEIHFVEGDPDDPQASETLARPDVDLGAPPQSAPGDAGPASEHLRWTEELEDATDEAIAAGDGIRAQELLTPRLGNALRKARVGELTPAYREWASRYAVDLSHLTGDARWVGYVFELFTLAGETLPEHLVGAIGQALPKVSGFDRRTIGSYVRTLRSSGRELTEAEVLILTELEKLAGLES